jgi:hypothetical protein
MTCLLQSNFYLPKLSSLVFGPEAKENGSLARGL